MGKNKRVILGSQEDDEVDSAGQVCNIDTAIDHPIVEATNEKAKSPNPVQSILMSAHQSRMRRK